ncbi:transposase [Sphingomonas insulae]|uniref:transposase n=1 Tax=Sphingomonas insulae TaxID=424800 RepID=UPI003B8461CF
MRADLAEWKIEPVIPGRSNRRVKIDHERTLSKQRNRIERMFGHLKINRAIVTRNDQLASSFLGMTHLATARYWFEFVHAAWRGSTFGLPPPRRRPGPSRGRLVMRRRPASQLLALPGPGLCRGSELVPVPSRC